MTKSFKKALAVLLSVLMVISALPFTAITSFAEDDPTADLKAAMEEYETKIAEMNSSGNLYKNLKNAYDAYTQAYACIDAYNYGGITGDFAGKADTLRNATAAMTAWAPQTGTYSGPFSSADNSTSPYATPYYKNIVYAYQMTTTVATDRVCATTGDIIDRNIFYPTAVMLYDGTSTKPQLPVMANVYANKGWQNWWSYAFYPTAASDKYKANSDNEDPNLKLVDYWKTTSTPAHTMDWGYAYAGGVTAGAFNGGNGFAGSADSNGNSDGNQDASVCSPKINNAATNRKIDYYANIMTIRDNISFPSGTYYKDVKPYWYMSTSDGENKAEYAGVAQATKSTYIINYKPFRDLLTGSTLKNYASSVASYKQGGLSALLAAIDVATAIDINSYTYSTDTGAAVVALAGDLKTAIDGITAITNNSENAPKLDVDYSLLKQAMKNPDLNENQTALGKYNKGNENNENYTADSWLPFATAMLEAKNFFALAGVNGYNKTYEQQKALAEQIKTAEAGLVVNRNIVSTADLDTILDNAYNIVANKQYFNSDDYTASSIEATVNNCIIDIWGSIENYGSDADKILDSEEARATVASYIAPLTAAVQANQLNYDAVITSLGYSMNSAIEEAATYEANRADYGNYATLEAEVINANNMKSSYTGKVFDATVPRQTYSLATQYITLTNKIVTAIRTLRPAFNKITNGTIANPGTEVTYSKSMNGNRWTFNWTHSTGTIFFKTERAAVTDWKLPVNYFSWKTTESSFDAVLDSINFNADPSLASEELTAASNVAGQNPSGYAIDQAVINSHPGGMSINNANITLDFANMRVTSSSTSEFAKLVDGTNVTDMNTDLTEVLRTTEGTEPPSGGITAKNGTTNFTADATISVPATTGAPDVTTTPKNRSKAFRASNANAQLGFLYFYKYQPFLRWSGYAYEQDAYELDISVVDVCTLFEVIKQVDTMSKNGEAVNYTNASWNNLMAKLAAANSAMDYGNMSYDDIVEACNTRYLDLLDAIDNLAAPASNADLKAIIEETRDIFANDQAKCSAESWAVFNTAYTKALGALQGKYSDTNIRDYAANNADVLADIAKLVSDLQSAKDNLAYLIDFSIVDNAANALLDSIENEKYTMESIIAVKNALAGLLNLNMTDAVRKTHFTSETDFVAALNTEATTTIPGLADLLVEATGVTETLDAAKADTKAKFSDPDAYDLNNIQAILDLLTPYKAVEIPDYVNDGATYSIKGAQYPTQLEADAACTEALSGVQIQEYTVKRIDNGVETVIGTYPYGSQITVSSASGSNVDWYYSCVSNTTTAAEKLFSTGSEVTFIVKGDTNLRTQVAESSDVKKVSFVNALNGKPYEIQYVATGSTLDLTAEEANAPKLAYYGFSHFAVGDSAATAATSVTVNYDMVVYAVYEYGAEADTFSVAFMNFASNGPFMFGDNSTHNFDTGYDWEAFENWTGYCSEPLKYNDRLAIERSNYSVMNEDVGIPDITYTLNGNDVFVPIYGRDIETLGEVYAWVKLETTEDVDTVVDTVNNTFGGYFADASKILNAFPDAEAKVINYGTDYTFYVHENAVIYALTETEYNSWVSAGLITNDYTIEISDSLRKNDDGTMSIVGTYCLPDGAEVVENGVLFTASKNTITVDKLTLAEAQQNGKIARFKSTLHTVANQYVITVNITTAGTYNVKYCGYLIYKKDGQTYIAYSNTQDGTFTVQ
ncbi:MAG: hypothetical protein ACI4IL_00470 [Eubacterium sp.]